MERSAVKRPRVVYMGDQEWDLVKEKAKKRGQSVSEWFRDMVTGGPDKIPQGVPDAGDVWMTKPDLTKVDYDIEKTIGRSRPAPKPGQPRAGSKSRG